MPQVFAQTVWPDAAGGAPTLRKIASAATTNATSVKAAAGSVVGVYLTNTTAAFKYFRLFNKASAPTMGTDSPALIVGIPANTTICHQFPSGLYLSTGIAFAITGAVADLDATATAANDVVGGLLYV